MRKYFIKEALVSLALFLVSCSDPSPESPAAVTRKVPRADSNERLAKNFFTDCRKLYADALRMDSILLNQTEADPTSANEAIRAFTDYAYYCRSDSMAPVYLIKTAQVARVVKNIPQAKLVLEHCLETYPSFNNRPAALFLLAQLYDEQTYLNNEEEARKLYEQIIQEHPKSEWALSARGALSFIGKTDEEILKELKTKRQKK
jgi:tetratricopeptide (TPR) repeat protein